MANDEVPPTFWKTLPTQIRSLHRRGIKVVRTIFLPALYRDNHRGTEEEGTLDVFGQGLGLDFSTLLYDHPMTVIIIANIWRGTAFSMLIYQAALNDISNDVVEAGKLDGANAVRIFFSIKMPIIRRSILTNLMLTTLQTLSVFSLIIILTGGGPGTNSSTLPVWAYDQAFKFSKLGYGVAISAVTILIGGIFSIVYMRMLKSEEE